MFEIGYNFNCEISCFVVFLILIGWKVRNVDDECVYVRWGGVKLILVINGIECVI